MLLLNAVSIALADETALHAPGPFNSIMDVSLSTAYRVDQLDWNFSGNDVNVLSELEFKDITIYEVNAAATIETDRMVVTWLAAYGFIVDGTVIDSDYAFNDRNGLFSRSESDCSGNYTLDLSAGLGYRLSLPGDAFHITPLVGGSIHEQHFRITDGNQTVSTVPAGAPSWVPPASGTGPFAGLDSRYDTQWRSAWAGLRARWDIGKAFAVFGSGAYHLARYSAKADWNLRSEYQHPVSFAHDADASGVMFDGGASWQMTSHWALTLTGRYGRWQTRTGTHRIYYASGTEVELPLNEVNWTTQSLMLSLRATF